MKDWNFPTQFNTIDILLNYRHSAESQATLTIQPIKQIKKHFQLNTLVLNSKLNLTQHKKWGTHEIRPTDKR